MKGSSYGYIQSIVREMVTTKVGIEESIRGRLIKLQQVTN